MVIEFIMIGVTGQSSLVGALELGDGNHNFVTLSNFAEHWMLGITRTEPIKALVVGNIQEEL